MKISYECSELIQKLQNDIEEFGDQKGIAIYKNIENNNKYRRFRHPNFRY